MRPYWLPHVRLAFGGGLGNPSIENWTNSVRFLEQDGFLPDRDHLEETLDDLWPKLVTWFSASDSLIGQGVYLSWAKLNVVNADGKQRDINTVLTEQTPVGSGGQGVSWNTTIALTHRTARNRGRGANGRIFPPAIYAPVSGSTGLISANDASRMATSWRDFLVGAESSLNDHGAQTGAQEWHATVISPGDLDGTGDARNSMFGYITGVVADRVPDVQHRRTKSIPRSEGTLAPM